MSLCLQSAAPSKLKICLITTRLPQKQKTLQKRRDQRDLLALRSAHEARQVQRYSAIVQALNRSESLQAKELDVLHSKILTSLKQMDTQGTEDVGDALERLQLSDTSVSPEASEIIDTVVQALHPQIEPDTTTSLDVEFQPSRSQTAVRDSERQLYDAVVKGTEGIQGIRSKMVELHAASAELAAGYEQRARVITKEDNDEIEV